MAGELLSSLTMPLQQAKLSAMDEAKLAEIVARIKNSKKYKMICPATIHDIFKQELAKHHNPKNALTAAKKKLHRSFGAYLGMIPYKQIKNELTEVYAAADLQRIKNLCLKVLETHKSTSERIPILEPFYKRIYAHTGIPATIVDLACAMHPFALPWMDLPATAAYHGYDINSLHVELLNFYFTLQGRQPLIEHCDIAITPPRVASDVAYLFKMYHCLENRRKNLGIEILARLQSKWIIISFPTKSLARKTSDFLGNYEQQLRDFVNKKGWTYFVEDIGSELLLFIKCY